MKPQFRPLSAVFLVLFQVACSESDPVPAATPGDTASPDGTGQDGSESDATGGDSTDTDSTGTDSVSSAGPVLEWTELPDTAPAGEILEVQLSLHDAGQPLAGKLVTVVVARGGGFAEDVTTDAEGRATLAWRLGVVPVSQGLALSAEGVQAEVGVRAERKEPLSSAPFADVPAFLAAEKRDESTEDLVVVGDEVVMGAPGGLITVTADEEVSRRTLTGAPIGRGWGIAAEPNGTLWVVDAAGQTLDVVSQEGEVTIVLTEHGGQKFDGLNDVEVGPNGRVYASDPCTGRVIVWDPAKQAVVTSIPFDVATEGGPNGMTFDAAGRLYVSTENTSILCGHGDIPYDALLTRVVRFDVTEAGVGERTVIGDELGVFGDGMTFDAEGNLYAVIDTLEGLALGESAVWVFPGGEGPPAKLLVAEGVLYANVAFGRGALGETTLYLGLLNVPPFTTESSRGLQRVDLGLARAPWL